MPHRWLSIDAAQPKGLNLEVEEVHAVAQTFVEMEI
jgi:hypothetical protein